MNGLKKFLLFITVAGAVGSAYAFYTLKDIPDIFDFSLDEDEDDREI